MATKSIPITINAKTLNGITSDKLEEFYDHIKRCLQEFKYYYSYTEVEDEGKNIVTLTVTSDSCESSSMIIIKYYYKGEFSFSDLCLHEITMELSYESSYRKCVKTFGTLINEINSLIASYCPQFPFSVEEGEENNDDD